MDDAQQRTFSRVGQLTWEEAQANAKHCQACPLYKIGTQTVFGEGPENARVVIIGEQPGDKEDLAGKPFVGPAGKLLDRALAEAGIDRAQVYVTNAVKHFKWEPAGKIRLHKKPSACEVAACRPWLEIEFSIVQPEIVVALGATAAQALLGPDFRVTQERGKPFETDWARVFLATIHPSAILRAPRESFDAEYAAFVADLSHVRRFL